jgi:hypothetical protein
MRQPDLVGFQFMDLDAIDDPSLFRAAAFTGRLAQRPKS